MRSRRLFWGFLALGTLPLLLEATAGCHLVFDLEEVRDKQDNALHCACSCDAQAARSPQIATGADDAEEDGSMAVTLDDGDLSLGVDLVGLRFSGLGLPQGTKIAHAYVQFEGDSDGEMDATSYTIRVEASTAPAPFTSTDGDLSGRTTGPMQVNWSPPAWNNGDLTDAQKTPDLEDLLQDLVDDPSWNESSAFVLLIEGTGERSAESQEGSGEAARLILELGVTATLPVCARAPVRDANGSITPASGDLECSALAQTLGGLADACGYPSPCTCARVDERDPSGADRPDSFESDACVDPCVEILVDAPACASFDPNEFTACLAGGASLATCAVHVSATNAAGGVPYCVASGSPLAFHAFGERSLCEVTGSADILAGDRRPKNDPATAGYVELVGEPCPGGNCPVHPYLDFVMNPIEFEVRWASNPVFRDLGAVGRGLETAIADDSTGEASFGSETVLGTGAGRRGSEALALEAKNPDPLDIGIDWAGRVCDVVGTLSAATGDDGLCDVDGTTPCASDDDCVAVGGGACTLPEPADPLEISLNLRGEFANLPPSANAGADQTVECTGVAGASFTLDGSGSSDPDANLVIASWRAGTRTGPELSKTLTAGSALGIGASQSYVLRVVDTFAQTDEDTTTASVVDTTPPEIVCNTPATIKPPQAEQGLAFAATASDVCDDQVDAVVASYDCFTFTKKGKRVSKLESCIVSFAGDTLTIHDVGGYGDVVEWTVGAIDDSGNLGEVTCLTVVAK